MPHGPRPTQPILMAPVEVSARLVADDVAAPSRNPATEFSAGDWMTGLLLFLGTTADAVTLKQGYDAVKVYVDRLYEWNQSRDRAASKPVRLLYKTPSGRVSLELDRNPTKEQLTRFVEAAYEAIDTDLKSDPST